MILASNLMISLLKAAKSSRTSILSFSRVQACQADVNAALCSEI
jgi:hypothetical protein